MPYDDERGRDPEDHAEIEVEKALVWASLKHVAVPMALTAASVALQMVSWLFAVLGALTLPGIAAPVAVLALAYILTWNVTRWRGIRATHRADRDLTPGERMAKLRAEQEASRRRPVLTWHRVGEWALFTVPRAALAGAGIAWLSWPVLGAALGAVIAVDALVSPILSHRSRRLRQVNDLLLAEGEKPTWEI